MDSSNDGSGMAGGASQGITVSISIYFINNHMVGAKRQCLGGSRGSGVRQSAFTHGEHESVPLGF